MSFAAKADDGNASLILPENSTSWRPPTTRHACPQSIIAPARLPVQKTIQGWNRTNMAVAFIASVGRSLSASLGNKNFDNRKYVSQLVSAAKSGAYTVLDFEGPGGPSPVYMQSLLIVALAQSVSLLNLKKLWHSNERDVVVQWGNLLIQTQDTKKIYATLDSIAAIASAKMNWGAATQQADIFNLGWKDFLFVLNKIDPTNGLFPAQLNLRKKGKILKYYPDQGIALLLRINNEIIQHMVRAAEIAEMNNIPAYQLSNNAQNLDQVISVFTQLTNKHRGSYVRGSGFVAHLAWVPIYLSRRRLGNTANQLRQVIEPYGISLNGTSVVGNTACFWGYFPKR